MLSDHLVMIAAATVVNGSMDAAALLQTNEKSISHAQLSTLHGLRSLRLGGFAVSGTGAVLRQHAAASALPEVGAAVVALPAGGVYAEGFQP